MLEIVLHLYKDIMKRTRPADASTPDPEKKAKTNDGETVRKKCNSILAKIWEKKEAANRPKYVAQAMKLIESDVVGYSMKHDTSRLV
jgi:hypothetical protein